MRTMRSAAFFLTAGLVLAATERRACAQPVHELKEELAVDLAFTGTAMTFVIGLELAKADIVPKDPRWTDVNKTDETARDLLRWKDPKYAGGLSDLILVFFAPATSFATLGIAANDADVLRKTPTDGLFVLEAVAANGLLNQVVKYAAARERPYGHYPTPLDPTPTADARVSFYSGHTSTTFCLAAASGTIAYLRGYELAPLAWIPGATLAAFTGYLRVAADKHYFTDVLAGAVVGTAMGILVPMLFHSRADGAPVQSPSAAAVPPGTRAFTFGSSF